MKLSAIILSAAFAMPAIGFAQQAPKGVVAADKGNPQVAQGKPTTPPSARPTVTVPAKGSIAQSVAAAIAAVAAAGTQGGRSATVHH